MMKRLISPLQFKLRHWYVLNKKTIGVTQNVGEIHKHQFFGRIINDIVRKQFRLMVCVKLNEKNDYQILTSYKIDFMFNEKQIRNCLTITKKEYFPTQYLKKKRKEKLKKKREERNQKKSEKE